MERDLYGRWITLALLLSIAIPTFVSAEVFVADFNGDGKPDVLMSSPSSPEGFVVLLNQGEWDGKMTFKKTWPDVKTGGSGGGTAAYSTPTTLPQATASGTATTWSPAASQPSAAWSPQPAQPATTWTPSSSSSSTWTPPPASTPAPPPAAKPSIAPPPAPTISTGTPKLKTAGSGASSSASKSSGSMYGESKSSSMPESPAAGQNFSFGSRKVALFNYRDKTAGGQFAWLERGISNILKFDVLEVKSAQLIDREKTDVTFDPAWVRGSNLAADLFITGEFEEAAERLIVTTWFLTPSMSAVREFKVEGDRADIFSLIEKVGSRLKQELSSL